jgi:hydroxycarboxylate dehydrogenase B
MLLEAIAARKLLIALMKRSGSDTNEAEIVAGHAVESSLAGHDSHGIVRLPQYVRAVYDGTLSTNRHPKTLIETDSLLVLDGQRGYGHVAAAEATERMITKARSSGIAMFALHNVGHLGRIGTYAERAAEEGQATIYFANAPRPGGATVAPHNGSDRRLNSGPVCLGMPAKGSDPIVLDMATAAVAIGKIRVARNEHKPLPEACVLDAEGRLTDDPLAFFGPPMGSLLPFGGHKGAGLSIFTDLFGGILAGGDANYEGESTGWYPTNNALGIHIDPAKFGDPDLIADQVRAYRAWVKASPPREGEEVLMPGERLANTRRKRAGKVEISDATWSQIAEVAALYGLTEADLHRAIED